MVQKTRGTTSCPEDHLCYNTFLFVHKVCLAQTSVVVVELNFIKLIAAQITMSVRKQKCLLELLLSIMFVFKLFETFVFLKVTSCDLHPSLSVLQPNITPHNPC